MARRWVLNEEEEEELNLNGERGESTVCTRSPSMDGDFSGEDHSGTVRVSATESGEICSVRISDDWKQTIHPRMLAEGILAAVNAASMHAAQSRNNKYQAEVPSSKSSMYDEGLISKGDMLRLVESAMLDMAQFKQHVFGAASRVSHFESAGAHVWGFEQYGRVADISIDVRWASNARKLEIEREILDALKRVDTTSLTGLARGPQGKNIDELATLTADPHRLLQKVGIRVIEEAQENRRTKQ